MFDRFTEKARRVIFFAHYEASRARKSQIQPEHVLLGMIREVPTLHGVIPPASVDAVRLRLQPPEQAPSDTSIDMPLSRSTREIFAIAAGEADTLHSHFIDTPELLAALLKVPSLASDLMREFGAGPVQHRHPPQ